MCFFSEKKMIITRSLDYFKFVVVFLCLCFYLRFAACIILQEPEFLSVPSFCVYLKKIIDVR